MAKDCFQYITPPAEEPNQSRQFTPRSPEPVEPDVKAEEYPNAQEIPIRVTGASVRPDTSDPATRGIRSISAPSRSRPLRVGGVPNRMDQGIRESPPLSGAIPSGSHRR